MTKKIRSARVLIAAAVFGAIALTGCTPAEIALVQRMAADLRAGDKFHHVLSDAQLARLRQCESGGNYRISSASGAYRGAYQFHRGTWNSVASRHYPYLVGTTRTEWPVPCGPSPAGPRGRTAASVSDAR